MGRLIDADAAIHALNVASRGDSKDVIRNLVICFLLASPTVDAEPVRHGHWIIYVISPFDGEDVKCSECGERGCMPGWDYCPNCGAKMDGEVEHETD